MKVFLSYRRTDVGGYAGRLGDDLVGLLGAKSVFQDVTAIRPGQDFVRTIDRALVDCDVVLAVIGPGWLTATTPEGASRLLDPEDFVRVELSRALDREVPVIPVLVGNADLPKAADLPPELAELSQRQAVVLHDPTWRQDVEGLVRSLRGEPPVPTSHRRRWFVGLTAAVVLAAIAGVVWWRMAANTGSGTTGTGRSGAADTGGYTASEGDKPACPDPGQDNWSSIELSDDPTGVVQFEDGTSLSFKVKAAHWRPLGTTWQVALDVEMANHRNTDEQLGTQYFYYLVVAKRQFEHATCMGVKDVTFAKPDLVADGRVGFDVGCKPVGAIELVLQGENAISADTIRVSAASEPAEC